MPSVSPVLHSTAGSDLSTSVSNAGLDDPQNLRSRRRMGSLAQKGGESVNRCCRSALLKMYTSRFPPVLHARPDLYTLYRPIRDRSERSRKRSRMSDWPASSHLTGPICARALSCLTALHLHTRGHHDCRLSGVLSKWPTTPARVLSKPPQDARVSESKSGACRLPEQFRVRT
jgi:hypothetical protein